MGNPKRRKWRKLSKVRKKESIIKAEKEAHLAEEVRLATEARATAEREIRKEQGEMFAKKKRERAQAIYSVRLLDLTEATEEEITDFREKLLVCPIKEIKVHLKDARLPRAGNKEDCIERLIKHCTGKL